MNREEWISRVMGMAVLDTHTHLVGDRLAAKDFWELADYFWLFRELQSAGYPAYAAELPERERIQAFLKAYQASRNTLMNWAFTYSIKQLHGLELRDEASVREADAAIRASAADPAWAQQVADRAGIRRSVVNHRDHRRFAGMRADAIWMPRIDGRIAEWVKSIREAPAPELTAAEKAEDIRLLLASFRQTGCPGIMTTLPRYEASANASTAATGSLDGDGALMRVLHVIGEAAEQEGLAVQLLLGVERSWCGEPLPAGDPARILKLCGLFERYACPFELVLASEMNNLDAVQAAWNFPNVHIGGMWWYNFRASTYRQSMQYRLEAIAASKSSLIVSDARCIEWSFGKIMLVKRLLGEFLHSQVETGWLDEETALAVAEQWLYASAAARYGISDGEEETA
ncbi:glucuronate isomerase [Paenibacillus sp. UNCCL117]|uniref:hypothetical protein n=1 Tax=unclassified Paenibacillus TaxID=185978 RepID=UPI0008844E27|nr:MULTISPECIES: hypothetical protein [unclassified Paenibacillus]SDD32223.1 glucuronate isomerase [Paenibacillus sp. cl123]SFW39897.1 glucuronate isomerase [Paenibacillus sp. UNCCL117]